MFAVKLADEDTERQARYRHMATARRNAAELARAYGTPVEVVTFDREGRRKVRTIIHPDGRAAPPPQAVTDEREGCVRHEGRPCFCTPCRAERKAARRG
jgi:hypothetical protein